MELAAILIKRNFTNTGWVAQRDRSAETLFEGKVFKEQLASLLAVHAAFPGVLVLVDERRYTTLGNGYVLRSGDYRPREVKFV